MQAIKSISIDKKRKTIITEDIIYKKAIINNKDINDTFLKNDKISQTINEDNDNEENLINTDSTLDTAKVKYIYKKKLNYSKNKLNFTKPKHYIFKSNNIFRNNININKTSNKIIPCSSS